MVATTSILEKEHSFELNSYTRAILRRISKKYGISIEELLTTIYEKPNKSKSKDKSEELEYFVQDNVEYLIDSKTKYLYSYKSPNVLLGRLSSKNEPIVIV